MVKNTEAIKAMIINFNHQGRGRGVAEGAVTAVIQEGRPVELAARLVKPERLELVPANKAEPPWAATEQTPPVQALTPADPRLAREEMRGVPR
jgi:hypothetical protein